MIRATSIRWANVPRLQQAAALASSWGGGMRALNHSGSEAARLVRTAFHEGGHGAVARAFGLEARIVLESADSGRCVCPGGQLASEGEKRCIGLAGKVAGALAEHGGLHATGEWIFGELASGRMQMTAADAVLAGGFDIQDVRATLALVTQRWSVVSLLARFCLEDFMEAERNAAVA